MGRKYIKSIFYGYSCDSYKFNSELFDLDNKVYDEIYDAIVKFIGEENIERIEVDWDWVDLEWEIKVKTDKSLVGLLPILNNIIVKSNILKETYPITICSPQKKEQELLDEECDNVYAWLIEEEM